MLTFCTRAFHSLELIVAAAILIVLRPMCGLRRMIFILSFNAAYGPNMKRAQPPIPGNKAFRISSGHCSFVGLARLIPPKGDHQAVGSHPFESAKTFVPAL